MHPCRLSLLPLANKTWLFLDDQSRPLDRHLNADGGVQDLVLLILRDDYQAMRSFLVLEGG